jgi:hypothetical protein
MSLDSYSKFPNPFNPPNNTDNLKINVHQLLDYEDLFDYGLHIAHSAFSGFAMRSRGHITFCT